MENLDPPEPYQVAAKKMFYPKLHKDSGKKTLIFDLDETLIHCAEDDEPYDVCLMVQNSQSNSKFETYIKIRPYAKKILQAMCEFYEIMVFTAGHAHYADKILDYLDPGNKYICHRLYRNTCIEITEGLFIKDLRVLGQRKQSDIILVDNAIYSYYFNMDNGVPIIPFYSDNQDNQLLQLIPF